MSTEINEPGSNTEVTVPNTGAETTPEAVAEIETVVAPPAPVEFRYEYQPTDEQGRPLGGKQVVKYTTPEELADKLAEQSTLLLRRLRSETRKNRLGISDEEVIPEDAQRYREPVSFKPKQLTPDERVQLSRDLLDPEKFEEASDALFEAKVGAKPQVISQTLADLQGESIRARAKAESDAFVAGNPEYVKCQENFEAITNWMIRYGLAPVRSNFQKAFDTLRAAGVLIENPTPDVPAAPGVRQPTELPTVQPTAPEAPEGTAEAAAVPETTVPAGPPKQAARIPTGLSRSTSDETGVPRSPGEDLVYDVVVNGQKRRYTGLAAINAMPSEEFKRRVNTERGFSQKVEKLEAEAVERRRVSRR